MDENSAKVLDKDQLQTKLECLQKGVWIFYSGWMAGT